MATKELEGKTFAELLTEHGKATKEVSSRRSALTEAETHVGRILDAMRVQAKAEGLDSLFVASAPDKKTGKARAPKVPAAQVTAAIHKAAAEIEAKTFKGSDIETRVNAILGSPRPNFSLDLKAAEKAGAVKFTDRKEGLAKVYQPVKAWKAPAPA